MKTNRKKAASVIQGIILPAILMVSVVFLQSCTSDSCENCPNPELQIGAAVSGQNTLQVNFTSTSVNTETVEWDFGDGSVSIEENPTHTYAEPGLYTVTASAVNGDNRTVTTLDVRVASTGFYTEKLYTTTTLEEGKYGDRFFNNYELFLPGADYRTDRKLVIVAPGGTFFSHSYKSQLRELCQDLAQRGYAAAFIDYSLIENAVQGRIQEYADLYIKGVQDYRTAIRFFRSNAADFGINPDQIFVGGWSTGGTLAMGAGYLEESNVSQIDLQTVRESLASSIEKLKGLDTNDHPGVSSKPSGLLVMMSYSMEIELMDPSMPLLLVNHEQSVTVSDCQSFTGLVEMNFVDGAVVASGTDVIEQTALDKGMTKGSTMDYILMTDPAGTFESCSTAPNVLVLSSENFPAIASFFGKL